eukprot:6203787-Pleurochrysis_carterae.AAC.2
MHIAFDTSLEAQMNAATSPRGKQDIREREEEYVRMQVLASRASGKGSTIETLASLQSGSRRLDIRRCDAIVLRRSTGLKKSV